MHDKKGYKKADRTLGTVCLEGWVWFAPTLLERLPLQRVQLQPLCL